MKLKANGIEINYENEGRGPGGDVQPLAGLQPPMWDEQVARARAAATRVLRYDTRGHGADRARPTGAYTLDQMADDLKGLLDGLGIKETHFVGLSMGGMIGQTFALKHPAMVQSLVLCDTTSRYPAAAAPVWEERIKTVGAKGMEPHGGGHARALVHRAVPRAPDGRDGAGRRHDPQHAARGLRRLLPRHPQDQRDRAAQATALPGPGHRRRGGPGHAGRHGARHPRGAAGGRAGRPALGVAPVQRRAAGGVQPGARRLPRQG